MNRICIVLNEHGEFTDIAADQPLEIYVVCPHCPADRVYQYGAADFGPEHVRKLIGGFAIGHLHDGTFGMGDGTGKRSPSRPALTVVKVGE
jgi:hypothetical protein